MRRSDGLLIAVAIVALFALGAKADKGKNGINLTSATEGTRSVAVAGNYLVTDDCTVVNIEIVVRPAGGKAGEGGVDRAAFDKGFFRGSVSVPAGKYDVQAWLTVRDKKGNVSEYVSNVKTVTVM